MMRFSLKQVRLLNSNTLEDFAKLIGVSVPTYAKLEKNPELLTLRQARIIADKISEPIDSFFIYPED